MAPACLTVRAQIWRGIAAVAALVGAWFMYPFNPLLAYALIGVALFAMRGCPACWVAGMCDSVKQSKKPAAAALPEESVKK